MSAMKVATVPPRYTLTIAALPDPLTRYGGRERPPEYRLREVLKRLARSGFRVVSVKPAEETDEPSAAVRPAR